MARRFAWQAIPYFTTRRRCWTWPRKSSPPFFTTEARAQPHRTPAWLSPELHTSCLAVPCCSRAGLHVPPWVFFFCKMIDDKIVMKNSAAISLWWAGGVEFLVAFRSTTRRRLDHLTRGGGLPECWFAMGRTHMVFQFPDSALFPVRSTSLSHHQALLLFSFSRKPLITIRVSP